MRASERMHQIISQLREESQHAVQGNCGTVVSFQVGADDAPIISKAIEAPERDFKDLKNLGRGEASVCVLSMECPARRGRCLR